jgi:hypothetical protein
MDCKSVTVWDGRVGIGDTVALRRPAGTSRPGKVRRIVRRGRTMVVFTETQLDDERWHGYAASLLIKAVSQA